MPLKEFKCKKCGYVEEVLLRINDPDPERCVQTVKLPPVGPGCIGITGFVQCGGELERTFENQGPPGVVFAPGFKNW